MAEKLMCFYPIVSVSSIQNLSKESVDNNLARIIKKLICNWKFWIWY